MPERDLSAQKAMAEGSEATALLGPMAVLPCLAFDRVAWLNSPYDAKRRRRRPEVNETRFLASFPPYLDIAIVFCTFVWAVVVQYTCVQPGD